MKLTGKQRGYLRKLAQELDPCIMIGKSGLSEQLVKAADEALDHHELIKVRFSDFKDEKKDLSKKLAQLTKSEIIGQIGHVAMLYRQNSDIEKRKIKIIE
ncbi:MAG: YhbY family RNA-binding protein [Spirochaetes bacterium]|nr:YhbY family RNA-binding protein [Spirochaetota bacterium]MBN2771983.1 YhbY family RNA-binding protein [Spirochaetota bacterium]